MTWSDGAQRRGRLQEERSQEEVEEEEEESGRRKGRSVERGNSEVSMHSSGQQSR